VGAVFVSDQNPEGIHATQEGCCSQCEALETCTVWVHQPSVNHCWLMRSNGTARVGHKTAQDRTLGYKSTTLRPSFSQGSYEYGFLWNMPNFGGMIFGTDNTTWTAHDPINNQVDVFVTTYSRGARGATTAAQDILHRYVDATGHAPVLPEWAAGYWHSPMGHPTYSQADVLAAAEGLQQRGLQTDLFIIDYFNWAKMGDYTFNPQYWPDPAGMVAHLASLGMRVMVSAWPFVLKDGARASTAMSNRSLGLAVHDVKGQPIPWPDSVCQSECFLYDPTSSSAREFIFGMLDSGYIKSVPAHQFAARPPLDLLHAAY